MTDLASASTSRNSSLPVDKSASSECMTDLASASTSRHGSLSVDKSASGEEFGGLAEIVDTHCLGTFYYKYMERAYQQRLDEKSTSSSTLAFRIALLEKDDVAKGKKMFKPRTGQVSAFISTHKEPYHQYRRNEVRNVLFGRCMSGQQSKYTIYCALRALDRGWRLLPADPHKAIKLRRTPSGKESRLAVTVLRSSSGNLITESKWEGLRERVNYEFETIFYLNQISPRTIATHMVRGATEPVVLTPNVETELSLSPLGAPVTFVLDGHEAMTTETANWTKSSVKNPHLTMFIAIRMPSEDIQDPPAGVWSAPFPGSNYRWCMFGLDN
ncbi:hypothetical protein MMC22_011878 [Lobaria immixta]|nr:hypothetical protein [Lobaria immixta]